MWTTLCPVMACEQMVARHPVMGAIRALQASMPWKLGQQTWCH